MRRMHSRPLPLFDVQTWVRRSQLSLILFDQQQFKIVVASQCALDLLGYQLADIKGRTTVDLGLWVDPLQRSALMYELLQDGFIKKHLVQMRSRHGGLLWIELSIDTVSVGETRFSLVSFLDVSDHQMLLAQQRTERERLARGMRGTNEGAWCWRSETRMLEMSPRVMEMLGHPEPGIQSSARALDAAMHPADVVSFLKWVDSLRVSNAKSDVVARLRCADTSWRWFRMSGHWRALAVDDEAMFHAEGTLKDIHALRVHQTEQIRLAARAELALAGAEMGYWEMDEEGLAVWDSQTYRLYGHDPGAPRLPSDIFQRALSAEEYARTTSWLGKCLKYDLSLGIEFELRWPDGQTRWLRSQGRTVVDPESGKKALLGITWDVTERHKTEAKLFLFQKELSDVTRELLEQERNTTRRLAQVLHDQLGQTLTAARLTLEYQQQTQAWNSGQQLDVLLEQAMLQVRGMLMDLRPPLLEEQGLCAALENEIHRATLYAGEADLLLRYDPRVKGRRWPVEVEFAVFMIAREAIANGLANGKAQILEVVVNAQDDGLVLEVSDDGVGFAQRDGASLPGHLGLIGMRERAVAINAALSIESSVGDGTRVLLTWRP